MSVKKLVTLATLSIASVGVTSAALAGGPGYVSATNYAGVYLEGNLGYAYRPWRKNAVIPVNSVVKQIEVLKNSSRGNGGFAVGTDLGYQFNQYFAVEGGWYYLPKLRFTTTHHASQAVSYKIKSGITYAALKGVAPVYENTYVFGKLGVAYTYNRANPGIPTTKTPVTLSSRSDFWNPLLAAGVQYCFTPNWSANTQYTFVPGCRHNARHFAVPAANLFTVGLNYKFLM